MGHCAHLGVFLDRHCYAIFRSYSRSSAGSITSTWRNLIKYKPFRQQPVNWHNILYGNDHLRCTISIDFPTNIPQLPTGTFKLPITTPSTSTQSCLDAPSLYPAWSCAMPISSIELEVSSIFGSASNTSNNKISIGQSIVPSTYFYGSQPPAIDPEVVLSLVNDRQQPGLGPAWYFQVAHNKVVVVPEESLQGPSYEKRGVIDRRGYEEALSRKATAQPGDRPWFCNWNGTILEMFIYVNKTSVAGSQQASTSALMTSASQAMGSSSRYAETTTAPSFVLPTAVPSGEFKIPYLLDSYPKIIKVEEWRNPAVDGTVAPYCVQMVILENGLAVHAKNDDEEDIVIYLHETEPVLAYPPSKRSETDVVRGPHGELEERDPEAPQACSCSWFAV